MRGGRIVIIGGVVVYSGIDKTKVAVIVVKVLVKRSVDACLNSILNQTHLPYEVIVVAPEGSNAVESVKKLNNGTVSVILCDESRTKEERLEIGKCRLSPESEYYICVDADDWVEVDYIDAMLWEMKSRRCDILCGGSVLGNHEGEEICNVPYAIWNKIYRCGIDYSNARMEYVQVSAYFRRNLYDETCRNRRPFDWNCLNIVKAVIEPKYEYISFDIFDTLVQRPFYCPEDLFLLLDAEFEKHICANLSFAMIRKIGEAQLRYSNQGTEIEDITIDEIYENIGKMFCIDNNILNKIKNYEKRLEIFYARTRKSVRYFYQLAKNVGKKVIFVTDMYLDRETIEAILLKNGYTYYEKVYISSEYRRLKSSGNLYDCVLADLKIAAGKILHIGDDMEKDINIPNKKGMATYHIPKALDRFGHDGWRKGSKTCDALTKKLCGTFISYEKIEKSLGYRCMIAQSANKYFDNPYRAFAGRSIFNQDAYFIGYYLLGMYLIGLNQWIEATVTRGDYDTVYFMSRDGWMPMIAYNILREIKPDLPRAEYFYTSRQAVLPAMLRDKLDFYDLPIDVSRYNPRRLFGLLNFCTEITEDEWEKECQENGISYEGNLEDYSVMKKTIDLFLGRFYSSARHKKCVNRIKRYYSKLNRKSIMFDMGYSGRIQEAVSYLAGEKIDVMFVHSDVERHDLLSRRGGFKIYDHFNFVPQMYDPTREYMLSSVDPSCIGYDQEGRPIFDKPCTNQDEVEMINDLQKGAQEFVQEFYDNFGSLLQYVPYKDFEVSLPLEAFLRFGTGTDGDIFSVVKFDDAVYGGDKSINLKEIIDRATEWLPNYTDL